MADRGMCGRGCAWQGCVCGGEGHAWQGGMCGRGGMYGGRRVWHGACVAWKHAWQGVCMAGDMCSRRSCVTEVGHA